MYRDGLKPERLPKQRSGVRIPFPLQTNKFNGFRDSPPPEGPQKADAHPETGFQAALEAFLYSKASRKRIMPATSPAPITAIARALGTKYG